MRTLLLSGLAVVLGLASGCASRPRPPAAATAPSPLVQASPPFALPPPDSDPQALPRSVQQIVREQQDRLQRAEVLCAIVGDERGRARAEGQVRALSTELAAIERRLDPADSDGLDRSFVELSHLGTQIEILHDSLRAADPDPGTPKAPE